MNNSVIGKNSAPGIFFGESEMGYSVKSLGITTLGVAGETLKGPAFERVHIADWGEYQTVFGGTSTEKFKESLYPKYELPYIAKSFLTESRQLEVVRVLGLSGYNAGPAWYIKDNEGKVIAVLRSRGHYIKYAQGVDENGCVTFGDFDKLIFDASSVTLDYYSSTSGKVNCKTNKVVNKISYFEGDSSSDELKVYDLSASDFGKFVIVVNESERYSVSLNAEDKDYILNVLGSKPSDSESLIYVEELYDVALGQSIDKGESVRIKKVVSCEKGKEYNQVLEPVNALLSIGEENLRRSHLGKRYLINDEDTAEELISSTGVTKTAGSVVEVVFNDNEYKYENVEVNWTPSNILPSQPNFDVVNVIYVKSEGKYYISDGTPVKADVNNYKERFRSAVTPWFVSQLLGNGDDVDVKRLFRFITISDGNSANQEIKVSIENILPDEGKFDVIIRDYADSDLEPVVLEKFGKCSLDPEASSFIGKKIGTLDGQYGLNSNYVMVEVVDNSANYGLVPCGFLGFPLRPGDDFVGFDLKYNSEYDEDIRPRKQYFGMSDLVGVDVDVLNYKGVLSYGSDETAENGYTKGFHLDSRVPETGITVDGEGSYLFDTVSANASSSNGSQMIPIITTEDEMFGTIYEDVIFRKFTVYPYGGFDGWDPNRGKRTNSDDFKYNKYKGEAKDGEYANFTTRFNKTGLGLDDVKAITTDYYAYLAAYRQFANPEAVDINVFATPGIDIVNNTLLVDEVLNILEDEEDGRNGDVMYVVTTPDKPLGAGDSEDEMFTSDEVVDLVKDTTISDSYVATYYPWIKYFDKANGMYIFLPPTKDVVRNFAHVDNTSGPWFAPAGTKNDNGAVDAKEARKNTKRQDENVLYSNFINPVKTFAQDGVRIWGNKTLYFNDESPLNRINVRRLMLRVKKLISKAGRDLIFDLNDGTLERQFRSIVEPILSDVKTNRGIFDYRLEVFNSDECDDEHRLECKIWIKPTPTMEQIGIGFAVTPKCVSFEE